MVGINLKIKKIMLNVNSLPVDTRYRIGMGFDSGLKNLSENDKFSIRQYQKLFQQKLNYLKQTKMIEKSNEIFNLFKNNRTQSRENEDLNYLLGQTPSAGFFCNLSLKDLGITKRDIILACVKVEKKSK